MSDTQPANTARPLRCVHYLPGIRLEQGGVVRTVLDWCSVLGDRGHFMTLLTYQPKDIPPAWLSGGDPHHRAFALPEPALPTKPLGADAMGIAETALSNADLLHLHGPWLDGNRQLAGLARRLGVPYLVSTHGMLDDWTMSRRSARKRLWLSFVGRRFFGGAACVHCTAQAEAAQVARWVGRRPIVCLPCLIDLSAYQTLPGAQLARGVIAALARPGPRLLFLSRLAEQKGLDRLLRAAAVLRGQGEAFSLLIAGSSEDDYESQMRALCRELALEDRVFFLGLIRGQEKLSLYQNADLFVLPTRHENFGLALIEAMACGIPCLTTRGNDIWRELQAVGVTIADDAPEQLAGSILAALRNPAQPAITAQARQWVLTQLATERLAERYEALYRQVVRGEVPNPQTDSLQP